MNLPAQESAGGREANQGNEMGFCSFQESSSSNTRDLQTLTSVYKMRQEQEKILRSFNTPSYSLLVNPILSRIILQEFGAQNMLFFENMISSIGAYLSSESVVSSINSVFLQFFHYSPNRPCGFSSRNKRSQKQKRQHKTWTKFSRSSIL